MAAARLRASSPPFARRTRTAPPELLVFLEEAAPAMRRGPEALAGAGGSRRGAAAAPMQAPSAMNRHSGCESTAVGVVGGPDAGNPWAATERTAARPSSEIAGPATTSRRPKHASEHLYELRDGKPKRAASR